MSPLKMAPCPRGGSPGAGKRLELVPDVERDEVRVALPLPVEADGIRPLGPDVARRTILPVHVHVGEIEDPVAYLVSRPGRIVHARGIGQFRTARAGGGPRRAVPGPT